MPVNKTVKLGVWEDGDFIGAVIFSCGSAGVGSIGKRFGLRNTEVAELARIALTVHKTSVTRIVKIALLLLKRSQTGLRLIVSYADPEKCHVGSIYQAGNWIYTGRSSPDKAYIDKWGRRWHSRSVDESGFKVHCGTKTKCPKPSQMTAVNVEPKYKYSWPLDEAMRKQIEPLRKPYPKKQCVILAEGQDKPCLDGGAAPTMTLQN
jgi:hypothetical protein